MTPGELIKEGNRIYGPCWQTSLARAIPVNVRTVRRWLSGELHMRPAIAERIRSLPKNAKPLKSKR